MQQLIQLKILFLLIFGFCATLPLSAQELNAVVSVNSSRISGTNRQVFNALEETLRTFINERNWTNNDFRSNERIDCSFTLIITEATSNHSFSAELQVQARRPVFNSTYNTLLLNFRDTQFDFDYFEFQPLEFDPNNIQGNLVATIAFYVYLILGLDFDSMSLLGGTPYFREMQRIAASVQPNGWRGWQSFGVGNDRNRFAIATTFNDVSQESFRQMWYVYHRNGLDEMANDTANVGVMFDAVPVLSSLYSQRPNSVLITLFGDTKLDELANAFTQASTQERQQAYNTLRNIFPTRTTELNKINPNSR
ncbi:MAG: DUF4835 family protein [Dysgonamonadaceae bacterium]|jgi:hypothetical protein|nr:DUF4835 family protein [Dysgonamonadaceae bacterium]